MGFIATKIAHRTAVVTSPTRDGLEFTLKAFDNADRIARQNQFSKTRFIQQDEEGETIMERDVPMGDVAMNDLLLGVKAWNLEDEKGPVNITRANLLAYLESEEFDFLLDEIRKLNPSIFGPIKSEGE